MFTYDLSDGLVGPLFFYTYRYWRDMRGLLDGGGSVPQQGLWLGGYLMNRKVFELVLVLQVK